jgi:hypothetical protein
VYVPPQAQGLHFLAISFVVEEKAMAQQTTITVSGGVGENVRALVDGFPGTNANRVGRALVRIGLRLAMRHPEKLVEELRRLDSPWREEVEANRASR